MMRFDRFTERAQEAAQRAAETEQVAFIRHHRAERPGRHRSRRRVQARAADPRQLDGIGPQHQRTGRGCLI